MNFLRRTLNTRKQSVSPIHLVKSPLAKFRSAAWALALASSVFVLDPSTSRAAEAVLECKQLENSQITSIECDFRLSENKPIQDLVVTLDGEVSEDAVFSPYANTGLSSAWLFMIDRTNPRRAETVRRSIEFVKTQIASASDTRQMGVATFASELDVVLPIGASHDQATEKLDAVKADGLATEYFSSALEAISELEKVSADRKALVIISDGKSEDTAYSLGDVVEAAKKSDVAIIGMGFAESENDTPSLQKIRRLSEETKGAYARIVGDEPISSNFVNTFTRQLENGGLIKIPVSGSETEADVNLLITATDGSELSASQVISLEPVEPVVEPPAPLSDIAKIYSVLGEGAANWAQQNQTVAWLLLLLLGAAILALIAFRQLRLKEEPVVNEPVETPPEDPENRGDIPVGVSGTGTSAGSQEERYGYFEVIGGDGATYDVNSKSVSMGRHSDNDILFADTSVHRHHAHLHVTPEGEININDLGTNNGVLVNGVRVEKAQLKSEDTVELGEVRLRFFKQ